MIIRREVHYSGNVQGVGFRYTVRGLAARFAVGGFVRNLPDGRVQMLVEGEAAEVERLMQAIAERMSGYIRRVAVDETPPTGEFTGFDIRF